MSASTEEDRLARVVLNQLFEPGDLRPAAALKELGASRLLDEIRSARTASDIRNDAGVRLAEIEPQRDLERAARLGIRFIVPGDVEWPTALDDLADAEPLQHLGGAPIGLWVRGPVRLHELGRPVAVVGSRAATTYGADVAAEIAAVCCRAGHPVVSGLAFGIDQAAHRGALAVHGTTVAVLANGVDRAYPIAHDRLLDAIAAEGAVVSELAPGCSPTRVRFLSRNRVIAALADVTVVGEAAVRSGALNTANWAVRLHRILAGVPGPVTSAASQGVHQLIRSGAAGLVTSGQDVLELLGASGEHMVAEPREPAGPRDRLTRRQQRVLDAVPLTRPVPSARIARTAGIGVSEVRRDLDHLARLGLVRVTPGDGWRLTELAAAPTSSPLTDWQPRVPL